MIEACEKIELPKRTLTFPNYEPSCLHSEIYNLVSVPKPANLAYASHISNWSMVWGYERNVERESMSSPLAYTVLTTHLDLDVGKTRYGGVMANVWKHWSAGAQNIILPSMSIWWDQGIPSARCKSGIGMYRPWHGDELSIGNVAIFMTVYLCEPKRDTACQLDQCINGTSWVFARTRRYK